ncbi:fimbrillin family protein [Prevotella copri]|uniref:fimbrillin family protein n=1 Tax=Segatella copri TaxID=165179 RepID=UPI002230CB30|nr:fimbrillin family protein [Segatella copri]MCW4119374.1 fimbrillin family protein [Segatella copri]
MKTMKIMKRLMGCAAAILALTACSESEDLLAAYHSDSKAVHITAQVGKASADGFTRSNPLGTAEEQAKFNENDEISVQADGQDAVTYKLVGSEWQPQGGKFLKWEKETMDFTAYYPASFNGTITQPEKYNSEADLAAADFMSFSGPKTNTKDNKRNQLTLTMERKMARVVVEIAGFNDQYTTNATVNSLSICGVKAYKQETDGKSYFYALIDPNYTPGTTPFLSLEVEDGTSKTTETLTNTPTFAAGNSYTYKLTVGKNKVSVSGITVADWTPGKIIPDDNKAKYIPYVTFKADGEQTFKMTTNENYKINGLEYSVNGGDWITLTEDSRVDFGAKDGDLRLRGKNPNGTATNTTFYSTIAFINDNVNVACTGDIRTLLDWEKYKTVDTQKARFCWLFHYCGVLTSAPELPATTLADYCYYNMFDNCKKLSTVTMLAPSGQITNSDACTNWLNGAGTGASSRTLKVQDEAAYNALIGNSWYLPDMWKKGFMDTTVLNKYGGEIK